MEAASRLHDQTIGILKSQAAEAEQAFATAESNLRLEISKLRDESLVLKCGKVEVEHRLAAKVSSSFSSYIQC